jgi:hypothetical protein
MFTGQADGTCALVKMGVDPHEDCTDESTTNPCGQDGTCDGAGACHKYPLGHACGPASCSGSSFVAASTCDGAGTCATGASTACGIYACTTTGCAKPCTVNTDCPQGNYCATANGTCHATKVSGSGCAAGTECSSGFCSPDLVCCDSACTGTCMACTKTSTGQADGTCAAVTQGLTHNADCTPGTTTSCGFDGKCDGKGACEYYGSNTTCASAGCSGQTFTPAKVCNGSGTCVAGGSQVNCGQSACAPDGCKTACTTDTDCASGSYCVVGSNTCTTKKTNGTACGAGNECTSGACVDSICCQNACTQLCYACTAAKTGGSDGTCQAIKAGTANSGCTSSDQSTCGQDGTCDGNGQCRVWVPGTQCGAGMCVASGNYYLSTRTCNQGTCTQATQTSCGSAACDPTTGCKKTCASNTDCVGTTYCNTSTNTCSPQKTGGTVCGAAGECLSGYCVDGVCCNTLCNGTCVSCAAKDNGVADGTCANVTAGTDPAGECTAGSTTCGLDGTCGGGKCRYAPTTIKCGTVGCMGSTLTPQSSCDGNGNCPAASPMACPGLVICASSSACKSPTCSADTDCISGYYCAGGTCTLKITTGNTCSANNQCSTGQCSSDKVCCSSACGMSCQGCSVSNTGVATGTCAPRIPPTFSFDVALCNGACPQGYMTCTGGANPSVCNAVTWNFDAGPPPASDPFGWNPGDGAEAYSTMFHHSGAYSLQQAENANNWNMSPYVYLCDSGSGQGMDLRGHTVTYYFYPPGPGPAAGGAFCGIYWTGNNGGNQVQTTSINYDTWNKFSTTLPTTSDALSVYQLSPFCNFGQWGQIYLYLDDISVN